MDSNRPLPAGLLVRGTPDEIAADFAAIALLQPVTVTTGGVICAPRAAPDLARDGMARCVRPTTPLPTPPGWPDPPSLTAGHWYLRSPGHMAGPDGFRDLIQVPGEGFGAWPHPTTLMCLTVIETLDDGAAIDLGCGSGLLTQAWAALRGPVHAIDLDSRAVAHTTASLTHARLRHPVIVDRAAFAGALPESAAPTLLANVPPRGHHEIQRSLPAAARTIVASGVRTSEAALVVEGYRAHGFAPVAHNERDGWGLWLLRRGG